MEPKGLDLVARDRVLVVGKTGFGKSTFLKKLLAQLMRKKRRLLFGDYQDEYSVLGEVNEQRTLGPLLQRVTLDELLELPELLDNEELAMAVVMRRDPEEAAEDFSDLVDLAESTGDLVLGFDEVGMFEEHCRKRMHYVATQSRHWNVPLILASQRMVDIHPKARSQASHLISFHQDNPADIRAIEVLTLSEEFAASVPLLDVGQHKHWRDSDQRRELKKQRPSPKEVPNHG